MSEAPLRTGWTTGTCAAAASVAAFEGLLTSKFPDKVAVALPKGQTATIEICRSVLNADRATAGVIKDAGDDPDVTHGAEVLATVAYADRGTGIEFKAGEGVGMVTMPGLPLDVGEPAINPGPRAMIRQSLTSLAERLQCAADLSVTISVPNGVALSEKTLNSRLGIVGGISILGTTGIVTPFSCSAWIHSIHRGIDVARASGIRHLAAATGSTSEATLRKIHALPDMALIDMGDFVGGTLKYLRRCPVQRLTLGGGFAKITKLSQGHLYVHSAKSRVDIRRLAASLAEIGGTEAVVQEAASADTAAQVLAVAQRAGLPLADTVAAAARRIAVDIVGPEMVVDVVVIDRAGAPIGFAGA